MKDISLDQMRHALMTAQRRRSDVPVHAAKGGIVRLLRKHGEGVPNELEAMRRMSQGHRVFVVHEQDERPVEITSVRDLAGYAPDQIYTLAPQHKADGGMVHMADGGSVGMGINVASDRKANRRYADLIVDGEKKFESRNSDTLRPYVGKRVAIVRTGEGPAKAIGEVTIGEPIVVNKKKFRELEDDHMVPKGSAFDITTPSKHLYPLHDPVRYENERDVGHGIISRKVVHKADGGFLIGSLVETIPAVKPVVNALGFRRSVTEPAELPPNLLQRPDYDLELEQNPLGFLPRSTRPTDLPQNLSAFRADPTGKYGGTEGLETQAIRRLLLGGDPYNKRNLDPATSNTYTDPTKAVAEVYRYARMLGAAQKYGYPSLTPEEAAAFVLKEGRSDLGHSGVTFGHKKDVEFDKMLNDMYNIHARDRNFLSALHSKKRIADKFGISLAEAWNGVGVNDVGQTGAQYAKDWEAHKRAATHAKNKPLVDLIARGIAEGQKYGLPLKANRATDEISQTKQVPYAAGGTVQGGGMPTLAEMRLALMRQNPVNLKNIGVNEATNMDQKVYLPPNRQDGVMHAGGVDMSHEVPGQQLMPLLPGNAPGQPGVPGQPPTGMPQGQMPGAQASPLPAGFNTQAAPNAFPPSAPQPQPPSNILSMLPQGRALNAMQPTKMPAMASGGSAKTYTHEVFNRKTGETKGQYQSIETARKARDRYDNQYGAYVHDVRPTGNVKPRPFENSKQALLRDLKSGTADQYMTGVERFQQRAADRLKEPKFAAGGSAKDKAKKIVEGEKKATRVKIDAEGPGGVKGIVVPRHMLEGNPNSGVEGMNEVNKARAKVYGSENRDPLTLNKIGKIHKDTLAEHFQKPVEEQVKAEQEALARLRAAKHIGKTANTLDESEKLDTVRHEHDEEGRTHVGYASKGVAGHALYTSGHGENEKRHVINTCPGQTTGCGGGVDESGVVDTKKGTCFAPNAESQYPAAAVRRTAHEQAKHDPAMTRDWILAHTGSMREAANRADKSNKRMLFRPNVVDETDVSSRHVIRHLNEQRKAEGKPGIVANSYGKTNELHDPENGYHVTHSNVGPKVKHGREVSENIGRDKQRVRNTITATSASGEDFKNEQGNHTPPKGSYMVTDVKRGSPLAKNMEKHITHAKYWSTGREQHELTPEEKEEGEEGHFGPNGKPTSPDKSHYGHTTVNGRRYDYQRQHILHPRLVQVGENKDGTPHMIPTDSRFKDTEFLPKKRFQTKNGKDAGHILMTTPTESTSNLGHETSFTHNVTQTHIEHAQKNKGEYEIDKPEDQEKARGKEYAPPQPLKFMASGGYVSRHHGFEQDDYHAFPEQNLAAQRHLAKRLGEDEERKERKPAGKKAVVVHKDLDTMRYEMMTKKGK